jgi:choline dehydrogenase-like flavoprotein
MQPRARGSVRIASADPAAAPLIDPNFCGDPHDIEVTMRGLRMARDILRQPALRPFIKAEVLPGAGLTTDEELFDYGCRHAKTDHHPVGTCRMGNSDDAVVTPDLKVRGLEGLRVVDSSVMPQVNSSNTNAPTIMIAEKAADIIRGRPPLPRVDLSSPIQQRPRP